MGLDNSGGGPVTKRRTLFNAPAHLPSNQAPAPLPAGEAILTVLSLRNPTQTELDRLLMPLKAPEIADEE